MNNQRPMFSTNLQQFINQQRDQQHQVSSSSQQSSYVLAHQKQKQHINPKYPLHPPPSSISSTRPLPTHHPLQLLQWEHQEQQPNTWRLEKYNRLYDSRKQSITVNRGPTDRLVIQFKDEQNKVIYVYHNFHELESFCIHPLLFMHDFVHKDDKLLFCVKNQIDGEVRYKFRLKFESAEQVVSFCSAVTGYVSIKTYEEWGRRNCTSQSDLMNASVYSDVSTLSDLSSSISSSAPPVSANNRPPLLPSQLLNKDKSESGANTVAASSNKVTSPRISPIRSRSMDYLLGRKREAPNGMILGEEDDDREFVENATQTDPILKSPPAKKMRKATTSTSSSNLLDESPSNNLLDGINFQPIINVNVENLLSVEAVREFGRVLSDAIQTCCNFTKKQHEPEQNDQNQHQQQQNSVTTQKQQPQRQHQQTSVTAQKLKPQRQHRQNTVITQKHQPQHQHQQNSVTAQKHQPQQQNLVTAQTHQPQQQNSVTAQKHSPQRPIWRSPSIWKIYDEECKMEQILKQSEREREDQKRKRDERLNRRWRK